MKSLSALTLEFRIRYYETALKHLQQRDPTHEDIPGIAIHLHALRLQRPAVQTRVRSRCSVSGMCSGDEACGDLNCPGRWRGVHHTDGGHTYAAGVVFPIEPETRS